MRTRHTEHSSYLPLLSGVFVFCSICFKSGIKHLVTNKCLFYVSSTVCFVASFINFIYFCDRGQMEISAPLGAENLNKSSVISLFKLNVSAAQLLFGV